MFDPEQIKIPRLPTPPPHCLLGYRSRARLQTAKRKASTARSNTPHARATPLRVSREKLPVRVPAEARPEESLKETELFSESHPDGDRSDSFPAGQLCPIARSDRGSCSPGHRPSERCSPFSGGE